MARKPTAAPATTGTGKVNCRITKAGAGKVSKGVRDEAGDLYFDKNEQARFSPQIAADLEERGFVEVLDEADLPEPTNGGGAEGAEAPADPALNAGD